MITGKTFLAIDTEAFLKSSGKLDLETQGFYVRLLAAADGKAESLPDCERQIGQMTKCDVRVVRRLMKKIRRAGLVETRFGLRRAA